MSPRGSPRDRTSDLAPGSPDAAGGTAPARRRRALIGLGLLALVGLTYVALWQASVLEGLTDGDALRAAVEDLGASGPLFLIGLMTLAIVMSPIPSAPIALAAGAAYGHLWGTVYVATGAELGALAAFGIARLAGYEVVRAWLGQRITAGPLARFMGSQNALMAAVFVSRLLPFLSFDAISYAAGLTPLAAWRFALATLFGIVPASFVLAHFGGELASANLQRAGLAVLALGAITLVPVAVKLALDRYRSGGRRRPER